MYYRLHGGWSNRGSRAAVNVTFKLFIYGVTPIEDSFVDVQPRQRDQLVTVTHHSQSYCNKRNRKNMLIQLHEHDIESSKKHALATTLNIYHLNIVAILETLSFPAVLRIRDVYPGSRIRVFPIPNPGSQISDPGSQKTWGGKKRPFFKF